jgi:predicted metal-dependent hydrolase
MLSEAPAIRPRQVRFEWSQTPLHWVPGDPMTSHLIDVLHLLLPAGERWFVDVYRQVLPAIADERLRGEVRGFMGQEAVHARAHAAVLDHLREHGIETAAYTRRIEWLFDRLLGDRSLPAPLRRSWLRHRLAIIAAIEHFTCVLGEWAICSSGVYDEIGADAVMLDLLRWHAAEEVEHRCVAFDTLQQLGGRARYLLRVEGMLLAFPVLVFLWDRGVRFLVRHDPTLPGRRYHWRDYTRSVRQRRAPGWELVRAVPRYLRPSHHPVREASPQRALAYLASSPAALAARRYARAE